jgi:hypothetical protein
MNDFQEDEQATNSNGRNALAIAMAKLGPAHQDALGFLINREDEAQPRNTIRDYMRNEFKQCAEVLANTKPKLNHTDVVKLLMRHAEEQAKPENSLRSKRYIMK